MKKKISKFILSLLTVTLIVGSLGINTTHASTPESQLPENSEEFIHDDSLKILEAIENIPDELENQDINKTVEYFEEYTGLDFTANGDVIELVDDNQSNGLVEGVNNKGVSLNGVNYWACGGAFLAVVGSFGFPLSKVFKLKKALKAAGGVYNFVDKAMDYAIYYKKRGYSKTAALKKGFSRASKKYNLSKDIQNAILDIAGVSTVIGACKPS
ncbi:hypothetical protein LC087_18850 (plasmid) [Bacillus carboniphilus]|uniref:Uncharacterized protein n=1 Tax=Bacillus carboniphilus TaxID=86663 RepID=A0ABY9K158_9BACI|nr:hypothetical protein [Bacillus carboniphilus]WLR44443.1 hypothetical protein LC087_18850 [Bacillus carboniphilus]